MIQQVVSTDKLSQNKGKRKKVSCPITPPWGKKLPRGKQAGLRKTERRKKEGFKSK